MKTNNKPSLLGRLPKTFNVQQVLHQTPVSILTCRVDMEYLIEKNANKEEVAERIVTPSCKEIYDFQILV